MLYNLFSNFGNIIHILYNLKSGIAFIQYENIEYAFIAKKFLSDIKFYGLNLAISYVK
jgi:RNA recognition motif-containing protein